MLNQLEKETFTTASAEDTYGLGETIGRALAGGELILLTGGLGAGKTLLTKGIVAGLGFDPDEVTSPSFALVNHYPARLDVFHIDLWRLDETADAGVAVGLDDILENEKAVVIVEWAERLKRKQYNSAAIRVKIDGDGDEPRRIEIERTPAAD